MWPEHEALLNVVAQKQISAPAGNRTSLLLRVLKESIIAEVKKNIYSRIVLRFRNRKLILQNIIVIRTVHQGHFRTFFVQITTRYLIKGILFRVKICSNCHFHCVFLITDHYVASRHYSTQGWHISKALLVTLCAEDRTQCNKQTRVRQQPIFNRKFIYFTLLLRPKYLRLAIRSPN